MPTANEFWAVARQVVSERGGLVVGFTKDSTQPEVGATLDNVMGFTPQLPATVVGLTDWTDWTEQVEMFYRLRPGWGRGKSGDPEARYYRVRFEAAATTRAASFSSSTLGLDSPSSTVLDLPSLSGYAAPPSGFQGVTFWPRLLARILDFIVHSSAIFLAEMLFVLLLMVAAGGRPPVWVLQRVARADIPRFLAGIIGFFCYQVICTSIYGSTVGKLLLRMQVIQDDGSPCSLKSAFVREVGYFVDALFFGLIGYYAMKDDPEQKRHGDEWAHTIVCKRSHVPLASRQGAMRFVLGLMLAIIADIAVLITGMLVQMNL